MRQIENKMWNPATLLATMSIITLKVNGLNTQTKDRDCQTEWKLKSNFMIFIGNTL